VSTAPFSFPSIKVGLESGVEERSRWSLLAVKQHKTDEAMLRGALTIRLTIGLIMAEGRLK